MVHITLLTKKANSHKSRLHKDSKRFNIGVNKSMILRLYTRTRDSRLLCRAPGDEIGTKKRRYPDVEQWVSRQPANQHQNSHREQVDNGEAETLNLSLTNL